MAVKRLANGTYSVASESKLTEALTLMESLAEEIAQIEKDQGLAELRADAAQLKIAATNYAAAQGIKEIDLDDHTYYKLIESTHSGHWILNKTELDDTQAPGAKSLRGVLQRKFKDNPGKLKTAWNLITTRVADPDGIAEAVASGVLKESEIEACYVSKDRAPYLRRFERGD